MTLVKSPSLSLSAPKASSVRLFSTVAGALAGAAGGAEPPTHGRPVPAFRKQAGMGGGGGLSLRVSQGLVPQIPFVFLLAAAARCQTTFVSFPRLLSASPLNVAFALVLIGAVPIRQALGTQCTLTG